MVATENELLASTCGRRVEQAFVGHVLRVAWEHHDAHRPLTALGFVYGLGVSEERGKGLMYLTRQYNSLSFRISLPSRYGIVPPFRLIRVSPCRVACSIQEPHTVSVGSLGSGCVSRIQ